MIVLQTIEETSFRFEEESQPADYVENLAENMHFYPPEHYITGDRLYYKYDPKVSAHVKLKNEPQLVISP